MPRHLLHVGYAKAASTFLQAWFAGHPQLRYVPGGLGGFRSVYELSLSADSKVEYYVTSHEGLSNPYTPSVKAAVRDPAAVVNVRPVKERQADVCEVLVTLFPVSRVLIVTRGFKSMMISSYSQYVREGGVYHLREGAVDRLRQHFERPSEMLPADPCQYWDYDHVVGLYADAFGEDNVIVLPFELLRDDRDAFLSILEERLGLEHHDVNVDRLNPSLSPAELYWYPVMSRAVFRVVSRLNGRVRARLHGWYLNRLFENRFRRVVNALHGLLPSRVVTADDFPADVMDHCRGRAERLRHHPLYAPYPAEYLWE